MNYVLVMDHEIERAEYFSNKQTNKKIHENNLG